LGTPSPIRENIDKQIEELLQYKQHMKDAIPKAITNRFPDLPDSHNAVLNFNFLYSHEINDRIERIKDMLINSIVISQQGNWILITQVEVYLNQRRSNT
jgi:hypothetical protein